MKHFRNVSDLEYEGILRIKSHMFKESKFKEIFVFVTGSTPQIVTETIYCLANKEVPILPNDIFFITTEHGKKVIKDRLLDSGVLSAFFSEYSIITAKISENSFIIPTDKDGNTLIDIRNSKENEIMGNLIISFIKEMTRKDGVRLHCSIAGGRKTMSFYLGAALQLFGRQWDRLYHVLVSPEFESNPDFFYKPKQDKIIDCRLPDGTCKKLNTKDAVIELAELPFIRLSSKLNLKGIDYYNLVTEGQKEIDVATIHPDIKLNLTDRTIDIGGLTIELTPAQVMIYALFLRQKLEHCKVKERIHCLDCTECFRPLSEYTDMHTLEEMARDYVSAYRNQPFKKEELFEKWKDGMSIEAIRTYISKINREIKENLSDALLLPYYTISNVKKYASTRYGIRADKEKITIE